MTKITQAVSTVLSHCLVVLRKSLMLLRYFLSGLVVFCLAARFLVKDGIGAFAVVYYSTPLPILAVSSLIIGVIWLAGKRKRLAGLYFVLTTGCLLAWPCESFFWNVRAAAPGNVKLFFWNTASNHSANEIASYICSFDADVIGIVESGIKRKALSVWMNVFSDYHVEVLAGGAALITRGKILSKERGSLAGRGDFHLLKIDLNGEQFLVLLVDIEGDPLQSRSPAFEQLSRLIRAHAHENLIVMGDFNTPLDSVLFESFRQHLTHAFEHGGLGFPETWPVPMPVLAIDHIWVSKNIRVVSCKLNWSRLSDHRAVVANIEPPL